MSRSSWKLLFMMCLIYTPLIVVLDVIGVVIIQRLFTQTSLDKCTLYGITSFIVTLITIVNIRFIQLFIKTIKRRIQK